MDNQTPLEKLQSFLGMEDEEISCMSLNDMREEVQQLGADPEQLSNNLKKRVSEVTAQAGDKNQTAYVLQKNPPITSVERGESSRVGLALRVFFQYFSKTDRNIINHCSDAAVMSQTASGVMVFLTGVLSLLSGAYAVYTSFHSVSIAIVAGVLYGSTIVFLDRELISSPNKIAAMLRLPLALIVGLVIAVPLELRLFESRISQELALIARDENLALQDRRFKADSVYQAKIDAIERDIRDYRRGIIDSSMAMQLETEGTVGQDNLRTGKPGRGPAYAAASQLRDRYEYLISQSEAQLAELNRTKDKELERIDQENARASVSAADDLLARYEAFDRIRSRNPAALYMSWGVMLLLILLQIVPVLVKLMQRENDYFAILEAERRKAIARINAIANEQLGQIVNNPYSTPLPIVSASLITVKGQVERVPGGAAPALT